MLKVTGTKSARNIREAIKSGKLDGNPYLPIFTLLADGVAAQLMVLQAGFGEQLQEWYVPDGKPCLISIGDDLADSYGPQRFHQPSIIAGLKLCSGTVLQVAAFQPDVMAQIAARLVAGQHIMIVECTEKREKEWCDFLVRNGAPQLLVVTTDTTPYSFH